MVFPLRYYLLPCINLFPSRQITYVITQNFVCVYLFPSFTKCNINVLKRSPVYNQPLFIYLGYLGMLFISPLPTFSNFLAWRNNYVYRQFLPYIESERSFPSFRNSKSIETKIVDKIIMKRISKAGILFIFHILRIITITIFVAILAV